MKLIQYKNSSDDEMVIVINEENDSAESMSQIEYERRQAEQSIFFENIIEPVVEELQE
jgi:hypothetical protein